MNGVRGWLVGLTHAIAQRAKTLLFTAVGAVFRARAPNAPLEPASILVLQLQQLGDSVIFTPTLRALRERFPLARIDLLATPAAAQVYKKSSFVNQIHVARTWLPGNKGARIRPMLPLIRTLRAVRYDCTITDITEQAFRYSLVAWLIGSPVRVGFDIGGRGFLHTVRVPFRADADWVDANLDIVRIVGGSPRSSREEVAFDAADSERVRALLVDGGHDSAQRVVVLHTGANWQSRTWYHDRWASLADALGTRHEATIVFAGSQGESEYIERIRAAMTRPSISLAGVTDIPQLAALCSMAGLFVGTDSGPRQIARASGCPHVVIMSSQDDTDRWAGWGKGEIVMRSFPPCSGCYLAHCAHKICMDALEAERVLARCSELLGDPAARAARPRQDHVPIPARLGPMVARGKAGLRALAHAPADPV